MRRKLCAIFLTFLSFNLWAQTSLLQNDREGDSYYSKLLNKKRYKKFEARADLVAIETAWREAIEEADFNNLCASNLILAVKNNFEKLTSTSFNIEKSFLYLRKKNEIDDVVLGIFKKLSKLDSIISLSEVKFTPVKDNALSKFLQRAKNKDFCAEAQFANFVAEINPDKKKVKKRKIRKILRNDSSLLGLDHQTENFLIDLVDQEFYGSVLGLSDYVAKKKILREQFPLKLENEYSDFVTEEPKKADGSLRMELYRKYSYVQIALMGKIITDLRTQLESERIEILVYERDTENVVQTISLDPMVRFRFAIKYLRTQMDGLTNNSFFKGIRPSYEEIVAASFELGLVTASEWDEVRGIEYIWNPQKTFWEKAMVWGKMILPVTSVLIPPPYGFISTLAIVGIDAVAMKNKQNPDMPHSLF